MKRQKVNLVFYLEVLKKIAQQFAARLVAVVWPTGFSILTAMSQQYHTKSAVFKGFPCDYVRCHACAGTSSISLALRRANQIFTISFVATSDATLIH